MSYLVELTVSDWDLTIERAQYGPHVEEKLSHTADRLAAAIRFSRLRGDHRRIEELRRRIAHVQNLLDQL